jgi:hypothetical protein
LRWQLTVTGGPTASWDATFLIIIAANCIGSTSQRASHALLDPRKQTRAAPQRALRTKVETPALGRRP